MYMPVWLDRERMSRRERTKKEFLYISVTWCPCSNLYGYDNSALRLSRPSLHPRILFIYIHTSNSTSTNISIRVSWNHRESGGQVRRWEASAVPLHGPWHITFSIFLPPSRRSSFLFADYYQIPLIHILRYHSFYSISQPSKDRYQFH